MKQFQPFPAGHRASSNNKYFNPNPYPVPFYSANYVNYNNYFIPGFPGQNHKWTCRVTEFENVTEKELFAAADRLGRLHATHTMFSRLRREKIGTTRTENMAKDLLIQNALRDVEIEVRENPQVEARRNQRLVDDLLKIQADLIQDNIEKHENTIRAKINCLVKAGGFLLEGRHQKKLEARCKEIKDKIFV